MSNQDMAVVITDYRIRNAIRNALEKHDGKKVLPRDIEWMTRAAADEIAQSIDVQYICDRIVQDMVEEISDPS